MLTTNTAGAAAAMAIVADQSFSFYSSPTSSSWEDETLARALSVCVSSASPSPSPSRPVLPAAPPPPGRPAKRKRARASRHSTTTFIAADPSNFREMVQQVTGLGITAPMPEEADPRPKSRKSTTLVEGFLPTLDTSAFLLRQQSTASVVDSGAPQGNESLPWFPTLESWDLM